MYRWWFASNFDVRFLRLPPWRNANASTSDSSYLTRSRIGSTCQLWSASGTLPVYNVASAGKRWKVPTPAFRVMATSTAKQITTGEFFFAGTGSFRRKLEQLCASCEFKTGSSGTHGCEKQAGWVLNNMSLEYIDFFLGDYRGVWNAWGWFEAVTLLQLYVNLERTIYGF